MDKPPSVRKDLMVIVGPSHAGKFLLLHPFQQEPRFGITDYYLWPNTFASKFFKDAFSLELGNPNQGGPISEADNLVLQNFNLDPNITAYFKDAPDAKYYYVLVNSQFMSTVPRRLNTPLNIFLPMVRDPRLLWIVDRSTEDKNDPKFAKYFFKGMEEFTEAYTNYIVGKPRVSLIYFEELIADFSGVMKERILRFVPNYDQTLELKRPSEQVNKFFTTDDKENNKWFGYKDQKALDLVSDVCRDYIKLFGYKEKLTVDEIYEGAI